MAVDTTKGGIPWQPSLGRHVPWQALAALAGATVCCVGCGVILATSDGQAVATWPRADLPVAPAVLLSLMISVANMCLLTALGKGYEIAWWLQALRGAELRRLQFDLQIQQSVVAALASVHPSVALGDPLTLAALVALAVGVLDGPVIQKATNVTTVTSTSPSTALPLASLVLDGPLPANFSAFSGDGADTVSLLTPVFSRVSRAYANRAPMAMPAVAACAVHTNTTCQFRFPAPGFQIDCSGGGDPPAAADTIPYDFANLTVLPTGPSNITVFNTTLAFGGHQEDAAAYSFLNWTTVYKPDAACAGQLRRRRCALRLATVAYPVTVAGGAATLAPWADTGPAVDEVLAITDTSGHTPLGGYGVVFTGSAGAGSFFSMLGGLAYVLNNLYASTANLRLVVTSDTPYGFSTTGPGQAATNYLANDSPGSVAATFGNCTMAWSDPTADMVNTVRELMFRSALAYAAANTTATRPQTTVAATLVRTAAVYQSLYRYLAATVACMALQMAVTLFLLGGWPRLGRRVSLDPFEIARALGAPLLAGGGGGGEAHLSSSSNSELDDALAPLKKTRLRYGEVSPATAAAWEAAAKRMKGGVVGRSAGGGREEKTQGQSQSQKSGQPTHQDESSPEAAPLLVASRLGLDRADRVEPIRKGVLY